MALDNVSLTLSSAIHVTIIKVFRKWVSMGPTNSAFLYVSIQDSTTKVCGCPADIGARSLPNSNVRWPHSAH